MQDYCSLVTSINVPSREKYLESALIFAKMCFIIIVYFVFASKFLYTNVYYIEYSRIYTQFSIRVMKVFINEGKEHNIGIHYVANICIYNV